MTMGHMDVATIEAKYEGDWLVCPRPGCGRKLALGVEAFIDGARLPCKGCRRWVRVPKRVAKSGARRRAS